MDHHRSTEEHLKGLKNSVKGQLREFSISQRLHSHFIAVLISPKVLRELGCGQVDICYFDQGEFFVVEIKTHPELISRKQIFRLRQSCKLLQIVTGAQCHLRIIKSLPKDLSLLNLNI